MTQERIFTSESVTAGHPDKLADQISDAIVDQALRENPRARIVAECALARGAVFIAVRSTALEDLDAGSIARRLIRSRGYGEGIFSAESATVMTSFDSLPAADLRPEDLDAPAEQQVTVFGFACRQTANLMPLPIHLAHRLARRLHETALAGEAEGLAPDGQAQVAVAFDEGRPVAIRAINILAASAPESDATRLAEALRGLVIDPVFAEEPLRPDAATAININPGGPLLVGGPARHAGLTGRKMAMDLYGGFARQGTSALSGKDPGRIDRTAAYAARQVAKCVVAAGLAERCELQLSYAIGEARPIGLSLTCFGTAQVEEEEIARRVEDAFDLRAGALTQHLGLAAAIETREVSGYEQLAAYGQVGRDDAPWPWEDSALAAALSG